MSDYGFASNAVELRVTVNIGGNGHKLWMAFPRDQWEALSQDPEARDRYITYRAKQLAMEHTTVTWRVAGE